MNDTTLNPISDASGALSYDTHGTLPPAFATLAAHAGRDGDPVRLSLDFAGFVPTTSSAAYLCGEVFLGLLSHESPSLGRLVWEALIRPIPPALEEIGCSESFDPSCWEHGQQTFVTNVAIGLGLGTSIDFDELVDAVSERLAPMAERVARDLSILS